jgi:hypothetical protein
MNGIATPLARRNYGTISARDPFVVKHYELSVFFISSINIPGAIKHHIVFLCEASDFFENDWTGQPYQ